MAVYYNGPPVDGGLYALYGTAIFMLSLGLLSDEPSLRNPAPPGQLTQIVISPTRGLPAPTCIIIYIFYSLRS